MPYPPVHITHPVPKEGEPGAFGAVRKHDIHTGIDLYCKSDARVFAIEAGKVVAVEKFTGEHAGSPWWNNTWAILIESERGVLCYGELKPMWWVQPGYEVCHGEMIGEIIPVLKKDKGVTPVSMLHLELYKKGTGHTVWWNHGNPQPEELLDPTELVRNLYGA